MILRENLSTDIIFRYDEALKIATEGIEYCFNPGDASNYIIFI